MSREHRECHLSFQLFSRKMQTKYGKVIYAIISSLTSVLSWQLPLHGNNRPSSLVTIVRITWSDDSWYAIAYLPARPSLQFKKSSRYCACIFPTLNPLFCNRWSRCTSFSWTCLHFCLLYFSLPRDDSDFARDGDVFSCERRRQFCSRCDYPNGCQSITVYLCFHTYRASVMHNITDLAHIWQRYCVSRELRYER